MPDAYASDVRDRQGARLRGVQSEMNEALKLRPVAVRGCPTPEEETAAKSALLRCIDVCLAAKDSAPYRFDDIYRTRYLARLAAIRLLVARGKYRAAVSNMGDVIHENRFQLTTPYMKNALRLLRADIERTC